ncbi:MAG: serine/threonine protein kinase [Chlamydiia bacterium]|nr:serine/threonine protein kinase [Chlamydiia bacterium]
MLPVTDLNNVALTFESARKEMRDARKFLVLESGTEIEIIGEIARGAFAYVRETGDPTLVLKTPQNKAGASEDVENDARMLKFIGPALGIQKPSRAVTYAVEGGEMKIGLLAHRYDGTGEDFDPSDLPIADRMFFLQPLLHGLLRLKKLEIHHGDIKLRNTLISIEGFVLSDFGGARQGSVTAVGSIALMALRAFGAANTLEEGQKEDLHALGTIFLDIADSRSTEDLYAEKVNGGKVVSAGQIPDRESTRHTKSAPKASHSSSNQPRYSLTDHKRALRLMNNEFEMRLHALSRMDSELAAILRKMLITNAGSGESPNNRDVLEVTKDFREYMKKNGLLAHELTT